MNALLVCGQKEIVFLTPIPVKSSCYGNYCSIFTGISIVLFGRGINLFLLSCMWLKEWETENVPLPRSRMRIVVMCFKSTLPFPREEGNKGCPQIQTEQQDTFPKLWVPRRRGCKYSQLLYTSLWVAKSLCNAPREGWWLSFAQWLVILPKYLTGDTQKLLLLCLMSNIKILCSKVCIISLSSPSSPTPSHLPAVKSGLHLDAWVQLACKLVFVWSQAKLWLELIFASMCLYQFIVSFHSCQLCFTLFFVVVITLTVEHQEGSERCCINHCCFTGNCWQYHSCHRNFCSVFKKQE